MKINIYYIGYKWEIIMFLVRIARSFHSLVFPLLALQVSYSWYLLWPNLIHSFMKLSQAPTEVINYSSLECLYLRRSRYWVCIYLKAPLSLLGPPVALACYFPWSSEMKCTQLKIHTVFSHKLQRTPNKRGLDPLWLRFSSPFFLLSLQLLAICKHLVIRTVFIFFMIFFPPWVSLKS